MKKGQIVEGIIERVDFPNKGILRAEDGTRVIVKNAIMGQKVSAAVNKVRKGKCEGRLLEVLEKSALELPEPGCVHYGICGGCTFQSLPYEEQLSMKEQQVKDLIDAVITEENKGYEFLPIKASPRPKAYRNKMEFSFGDEYKDGPLALGMHKRGSFYDIVNVGECQIVDEDFRRVLKITLEYFKERQIPFYHKLRHTGYLRHFLVRKAAKTGEILVDLVTTTQTDGLGAETESVLLDGWVKALCEETYDGVLKGILHTKNDSVADTIKNEGTDILFGQDFFYEELLDLKFKITPFSFFQTNSLGAEVLYQTAREFIGDALDDEASQTVFDLYSGTGTIAQILSPVAKKVIGVEIVEEAVVAARENAALNGLTNCEFIAGDVLKVIDTIGEKPDYIVLDPPRDGIHPKALEKIIRYNVPQMVYISCKPTSLARDLEIFLRRGYRVERCVCVDQFAQTARVCPGLLAVAPGGLMQEIADFSLLYSQLLLLYYRFTGEKETVDRYYGIADGILKHFSQYAREDGLLEQVADKWNLVDWPENLRDGYDFPLTRPVVALGCHNVINALYIGAMETQNTLAEICGREMP